MSLAWLLNLGYIPEDPTQFNSLRFQNLKCHIWDRERLILEIFRYRCIESESILPLVADLQLRKSSLFEEKTVSDDQAENGKFYTFHSRHQADKRKMVEEKKFDVVKKLTRDRFLNMQEDFRQGLKILDSNEKKKSVGPINFLWTRQF